MLVGLARGSTPPYGSNSGLLPRNLPLVRDLVGSDTMPRRASRMTGKPNEVDAAWVRSAVERFEGPLILYASRVLGDAEAARDVVQDTFLRLCAQTRAQVDGRLAEWLFTVCRNRSLDVLR